MLWVGSKNGIEADLVEREGINFSSIPAAGVHGVNIKTLPGNLIKILSGIFASKKVLRQFKPDVILFTGGYVAVPMALATGRIPKLLYVPDIEPGLALKFLSRSANQIAVTTKSSFQYFKDQTKLVVTGYPIRSGLKDRSAKNRQNKFTLSDKSPVLLFLGGSKGARSINTALQKNLPRLLDRFQIIHITGQLDWDEIDNARQDLPQTIKERYHAFPYLHEEMGWALSSADLVISRAGASTLGEYPYFNLPAVLVPYPHAWRYQKVNADYLKDHKAAIIIKDQELDNELFKTIMNLFDSPETIEKMQKAMSDLAVPNAASNIARLLIGLSKNSIDQGVIK